MLEFYNIIVITAIFLLAGTVKGVIGLGLPTISLALLSKFIDLPTAMALLLLPSFVTNVWQAFTGGNGRIIVFRIWPLLLFATATVGIGTFALVTLDVNLIMSILGVILIVYSIIGLSKFHIAIPPKKRLHTGIIGGIANGIFTGMTGTFIVPGVLYLHSVGFTRDQLIQAMGILFTLSTISLAIALQSNSLLSIQSWGISTAAVAPAVLGMLIGQNIRRHLSEQSFKNTFYICLLLLASHMIYAAVLAI